MALTQTKRIGIVKQLIKSSTDRRKEIIDGISKSDLVNIVKDLTGAVPKAKAPAALKKALMGVLPPAPKKKKAKNLKRTKSM